jgi:hypothetical protein
VKIALFVGAPAQGKTTTMLQFGSELIRRTSGAKIPVYYTFEESLSDPEVLALGDRALFTQKEWDEHSRIFAKRIEERYRLLAPGEVLLVESLSVGDAASGRVKPFGTNRGVGALMAVTKEHPTDSMVIAVIGDPEIERIALRTRKALTDVSDGEYVISDEDVINYLEQNHQLVEGLKNLSVEEAGALVRKAFGTMDRWDEKKSASIEQFDHLVDADSLPEGEDRLPEILEMQIIAKRMGLGKKLVAPIPPDPNRSEADTKKLMYLSLYMHQFLRPRVRVGNDRFHVVFNRYIQDIPIHYLRGEYLQGRSDLSIT